MAKYHIKATEPEIVSEQSKFFAYWTGATAGNAEVFLSPYGDYSLIVHSGGVSDATVKRTTAYKKAIDDVTKMMYNAYEDESAAYTMLHRKMTVVEDRSISETKLNALAPKKYSKQSALIPRPSKKEVEADLTEEAQNYQHSHKDEGFSVEEYVKKNLSSETENRQARWQEALELFESIENAREAKINAQYYADYEIEKHTLEDYINGEESIIREGISNLEQNLIVPVNMFLEYKYQQKEGVMDVDLTLEDTIPVSVMRTEITSSGKISIKNKLVRELTEDRTRCILGLMFFMGSHIFAISPNIQHLRIALWTVNKVAGFIWMDFDRDSFSRIVPKRLQPEMDVYNFPNVVNLKAKNNAVEVVPIDAQSFKNQIAHLLNPTPLRAQSPIKTTEQYYYISMKDALLLRDNLGNNADIIAGIDEARRMNKNEVRVSSRYIDILAEIQEK